MNPTSEPAYFLVWMGIALLLGVILLLTRLILNTEEQHQKDKAVSPLRPDSTTSQNFFAGLHGDIPRVPQAKREMLESLKRPPHAAVLDNHIGGDLIWLKDDSLLSSGLRYELRVGRDGPLLAVMEWATPDPLYALIIIGDQRWAYERRGEYEQMRISIRLLQEHEWVKKGSLHVTTGALDFEGMGEIKWITPVFSPTNSFIDEHSYSLATFDVSEQKGFADNTTWVVLKRELPIDLRAPIVGLGFFALTAEP